MMMLVKRPTSRSLYFGSGSTSRFGTSRLRGTSPLPGALGDRCVPAIQTRAAGGASPDARPAAREDRYLGRFAPYFDRDWCRAVTPCVSSEPRTMW